jgi:acyl transferase domain-containing protein/acyl carrier protein
VSAPGARGEGHDPQPSAPSIASPTTPSLAPNRPIAIVGIGCRYADLRGPAEFWEMVRSGRNTVREVPAHRVELGYDIDHFYDPRPGIPGKIYSRLGGFLDHPELFDPAAFGLTPRDAIGMEPQQRLMIEVTWDALEDAGIPPERLHGERVAVILGFMAEDYSRQRAACLGEEAVERSFDVFLATGISHAVMSGRISHLLGVTGPSFTLDTACSSSLYATHLACESLQRGEARMAIAGGVNVFLTPEGQLALSRSRMMSPDGKCKAFDAGANGFVRAEGAGIVVLRPLDDALAAGDSIYAVIRGTGVSADGRDGGHMMAPGRRGQAQAMRDAYARAGLDPARVHYVETHGTGTVIGDPVEIGALADVMGPGRSPDEPLLVASVKGNLGHAESASGVAGLIKTALAIRHRTLPAQLHFETPSPAIPWDEIPIRVQRETTPWPRPGKPLAAVNSFGISGTNAHVILEAAPEPWSDPDPEPNPNPAPNAAMRPSLLTISAQDPAALEEMVRRHRDAARSDDPPPLVDLGYTLGCRRSHRPHRVAVVADSPAELAEELDAHLAGVASGAVRAGHVGSVRTPRLVMVFPGQGSQWLGMGRQLLAREAVFRRAIERLDAAYADHVDWSLMALLEGRGGFDWRARLDVLQPLLVAVEIALAELLGSWGVRPDAVLGQSMGEIAAAHVAGCLSLEATARLACERGRVVARAGGGGAMGLVAVSIAELEPELAAAAGRVEVAGSNGPSSTLVSGDREPVLALLRRLESRGVFARRLDVDFASHCFHMDPLLADYRQRIRGLAPEPGTLPFLSTVEPGERPGSGLDVDYWVRNLREPVAFGEAVEVALEGGADVFLEVSPHATLARPIQSIAASRGATVACFGSLQRGQDEQRALLVALAGLHVQGVPVDFEALHPGGRVVATPLYAYQRRRYWFGERNRSHGFRPRHPLIGARRESAVDPRQSFWGIRLDLDAAPWLEDHRIVGEGLEAQPCVPATLHLELALAVAAQVWPAARVEPVGLEIRRPLQLPEKTRRLELQLVLTLEGERQGSFRILAREPHVGVGRAAGPAAGDAPRGWLDCARGRFEEGSAVVAVPLDVSSLASSEQRAAGGWISPLTHFERLEQQGLLFGRRLRTLKALRDGEALLGHLMLPRVAESEWYAYHAHPALVESAVQLMGELRTPATALRCLSIGRIRLERTLGSECWCRVIPSGDASAAGEPTRWIEADLELFDRDGNPLGRIEGVRAAALDAVRTDADPAAAGRPGDLYRFRWSLRPDEATSPGRRSDVSRSSARRVRRWLLISDSQEEALTLASELEKRGDSAFFCEKIEDLPARVDRLERDRETAWGLVVLGWADQASADAGRSDERESHRRFRLGSWSAAIRDHCGQAAEVWIATRGLHVVDPEEVSSTRRAGARAREWAAEIDHLATGRELARCRFFDASAALEPIERERLIALLGAGSGELQLAARGRELFAVRLEAVETTATGSHVEAFDPGTSSRVGSGAPSQAATPRPRAAGDRSFRVEHAGAGTRGGVVGAVCNEGSEWIALQEIPPPRAPEAGEVVVEVRAAALSGLDVLDSLGLALAARRRREALGVDFAGIVHAVGEGVTELAVGDPVMGFAAGAAVRRCVLPAKDLVRRPAGIGLEEAAALPLAYGVASWALERIAGLRSGQRVLIRSGGGGVGLAAVAVAQGLGAQVFATAGSEARRAALRARDVRLLDDRQNASAEESAVGFDVILTAEPGATLHESIRLLRAGGCLVDLAPRREFELSESGALRLVGNLRYAAVDFASIAEEAPEEWASMLGHIGEALHAGLWPTLPVTRFPVSQAARALRFLAQNRAVGRVVLDLSEAGEVPIRAIPGGSRIKTESRSEDRSDAEETLVATTIGAGPLIVTGARAELREQVAKELESQGERDVQILTPERVEGLFAREMGDAGRQGGSGRRARGLVHVGEAEDPIAEPVLRLLASGSNRSLDRPETLILVSLRPSSAERPEAPAETSSDRDATARAWEARSWLDQLLLEGDPFARPRSSSSSGSASSPESGIRLGLSISVERASERLGALLVRGLRGELGGGGWVCLDSEELGRLRAGSGSSLLEDIAIPESGSAGPGMIREELLSQAPAERQREMQRFVAEALASVLALGERERSALALARPLDQLGLDSLMRMELFVGLSRELRLEIAAEWFPPDPTGEDVARVLLEQLERAAGARGAEMA